MEELLEAQQQRQDEQVAQQNRRQQRTEDHSQKRVEAIQKAKAQVEELLQMLFSSRCR
jgi:hypothetical protein